MADCDAMTAETAIWLLLLLTGVLVWQVFALGRRVHRLEQAAGLRKPPRSLDV